MIRRVSLVVGMGLVAVGAIGCGSTGQTSAGGGGVTDGEPSSWTLRDPTVEPRSERLDLLVSERGCASGQRADDRIGYEVRSTASEVVITALVRPREGDQNCPANPLTPLTVVLDEPVGTRRLIDGATGGPPVLDDHQVPARLPVRIEDTGLEPVVPSSETVSGSDYWEEPRCELDGDSLEESYLPGWYSGELYLDADTILAEAVRSLGLSRDGWHLVRTTEGFGREWRSWTQYLDGVPRATVSAQPDLIGWRGIGEGCDLGGPWTPDPHPPQTRPIELISASEPADVAGVPGRIDGLRATGDGWTFVDPGHRCLAWVELEKELERSGHVLDALHRAEQVDGDVLWQVGLAVTHGAGNRSLISTSGRDRLSVQPMRSPLSDEPRSGHPVSELRPCWLDTPLELTRT